jgi:ATP-binding cassette subfamily B protein/subfamily B ATP-binding cassette protein MsbA
MIQPPVLGYSGLIKKIFYTHYISIIALLILSIFGMLFSLFTPLIMRSLVDDVLIGRNTGLLIPILLGLSAIYLVSALANYFSNQLRGKLDLILFKELTSGIFRTINFASLKDLKKYKTGDLQSRTLGNVTVIVQTVITIIPQIVIAVLGIFLPFFIMLSLDANLALIVISPIILFFLSSWYFGNKIKLYQKSALDSNAELYSYLKEAYSIIPLTKVFALENLMYNKYNNKISNYCKSSLKMVNLSSLNSSVSMLILGIPSMLVLTFGSLEVLNGSLSIGTLTAFMAYVGLFFFPIQQLSSLWTTFKGSYASYDRVNELFLLKHDNWGQESLKPDLSKIVFYGVCFSYDNRIILKDFHATFLRGRNYLIGENGSGKTTIIKLLCGLYSPDQGKIIIDDQDLTQISKSSLNSSVSVVFSDSLVFDGSIYENIQIGDLSAPRDEIIQAAKKAELHEFVMKLSNQYETEVGESGLNLSSGEKQKIALARVILRNSAIIIFDEFTRSIDIESKKSISSVIRKMKDKIVIIITHDVTEIENNCNHVYIKKDDEAASLD